MKKLLLPLFLSVVGCNDYNEYVTKSNHAPTIEALSTIKAVAGKTTKVSVTATDKDGDILTYTLVNNPSWVSIQDNIISIAPSSAHAGNHVFKVKVSDGALSAEVDTALVVNLPMTPIDPDLVNHAPTIEALSTIKAIAGKTTKVSVTATDKDGDILTYTLVNNPSWVSIQDNIISIAPSSAHAGNHVFKVKVSDGALSAEVDTALVVNLPMTPIDPDLVNHAPTIEALSTIKAIAGKTTKVSVTATDKDGDILTYTLVNNPSWVSIQDNIISIAPSSAHAGNHVFKVKVSDGALSAEDDATLVVIEQFAEIRDFIESSGKNDFDSKLLSDIGINTFLAENDALYKAFILKLDRNNLSNESILNAMKEGNALSIRVNTLRNIIYYAPFSIGVHENNGFDIDFYNDLKQRFEILDGYIKSKKYSYINDSKDSVINTILKDGVIDFNVIAKDFLGELDSFVITHYYQGNYNYIHSLNSANIFAQREGLSFGFVDQHKAPGSDSKLLVVRNVNFLPWSINSAYANMSKVTRNVIDYFSKGKEYVINNRTSTNSSQEEYSELTNGQVSFINAADDYKRYDAYFSNSYKANNDFETEEECVKIENAIKNGTDLILFNQTGRNGNDGTTKDLCMINLVRDYYGIEISENKDVYQRSYTFQTKEYPYFATLSGTSGLLGSKESLRVNSINMQYPKHDGWLKSIEFLSDKISGYDVGEMKDNLIESFNEGDFDKYVTNISNLHAFNSSFFSEYDLSFSLVRNGSFLTIEHPMFSGRVFEYSFDFGKTFSSASDVGILIGGRSFAKDQIKVRYNNDFIKFIGSDFNSVISFSEQILSESNKPKVFDVNQPSYVSPDGAYKIYGNSIEGHGMDLVIIGDGYLERDQALFDEHVQNLMDEGFYHYDNLPAHLSAVNFHTIFTVSNERGADNVIEEGCSYDKHDNCTRASTSSDFLPKDTAIDGSKNLRNRTYQVNYDKAMKYIKKYTNHYDNMIALINSNVYGGVGGKISVANKMNPHVFIHELGHGFAGLRDEYDYGNSGVPDPNYCYLNACAVFENRDWKHLMDADITIDTVCKSGNDCTPDTLGWFEGSYTYAKGMWRPTNNSIMKSLGQPFHAYNAEIWAMKTYERSGGQFSVLSPIGVNGNITAGPNELIEFSIFPFNEFAMYKDKEIRGQEFKWYINDTHMPQYNNLTRISYSVIDSKPTSVKVISKDVTGIIVREDALTDEYVWNINHPNHISLDKIKPNYRLTFEVAQGVLILKDRKEVNKQVSPNDISPNVFDGYLLELSNGNDKYYYTPSNRYYSHEENQLTQEKSGIEGLIFDVVITSDMQLIGRDYSARLIHDKEKIENAELIRLNF